MDGWRAQLFAFGRSATRNGSVGVCVIRASAALMSAIITCDNVAEPCYEVRSWARYEHEHGWYETCDAGGAHGLSDQ